MLAARNHRFRIAAVLGAVAYLILAAGEIVDANRILGLSGVPAGYAIAALVFPAGHVVGACGWMVVAAAFGDEVVWPRIRGGGTIVALSVIAYAGAATLSVVALGLDFSGAAQFSLFRVFTAIAAVLTAVAVSAVVLGCAASRRGPTRARWLRRGAILAGAAFAASLAALLFERAYTSDLGASHEFTRGTLVSAVGAFGLAVGAGVFSRGATRPLARREAALVGAAVISFFATVCVAGGEALIANGYSEAGGAVSATHWLLVAGRVTSAIAIAYLALGARAVPRGVPTPAPR